MKSFNQRSARFRRLRLLMFTDSLSFGLCWSRSTTSTVTSSRSECGAADLAACSRRRPGSRAWTQRRCSSVTPSQVSSKQVIKTANTREESTPTHRRRLSGASPPGSDSTIFVCWRAPFPTRPPTTLTPVFSACATSMSMSMTQRETSSPGAGHGCRWAASSCSMTMASMTAKE